MEQECKEALFVLRNMEGGSWQIVYKSAIRLDNCDSCHNKYDNLLMAAFEYCFDNGLKLTRYPDDTLLAYRHILAKYKLYGSSYKTKARQILDKISELDDVPEWYWYYRVRNSFLSEKRLLSRKIRNLKEGLNEYYLEEGQRPKNLNKRFSSFVQSINSKILTEVEDDLETDMIIVNELKQIFKVYSKNTNLDLVEYDDFNVVRTVEMNDKVLLIGACKITVKDIKNAIKECGMKPTKFDIITDYEETKKFDFGLLKNSMKYSCVILGPTYHSVRGVRGYKSISQRFDLEEGFPKKFELRKDKGISLEKLNEVLLEVKKFASKLNDTKKK